MESNKITENKKRKPNWTEDEKAILLEEYGKRKNTLRSRYNPSVTHLHKTKAWQEITDKINSRNLAVKRTVEEVMKKYENVVVNSRKEINNYKKESGKTGGGPPPQDMSETAKLVQDILGKDSPTLVGIVGVPQSSSGSSLTTPNWENVPGATSPTPTHPATRHSSEEKGLGRVTSGLAELQREVLLLQKRKAELEISKLEMKKENLNMQNIILQHKINKLAHEGLIALQPISEP
ncbi:myb/SANT-like DNA-binding domain-containing protein 4 [Onychostoma macrolepis]|uniref:myb/SANT-like DNA-binding domain-containing protein 4 n=1 Tax=Onychostoma macrolepis TaxID=369639 RepID=UPI00272BFA37|nr:myb/SANT-like DNA-binding domain-containing protein 4 [Onychostoma macrolepis]